jgi:hypothetical protein
VLARAAINAICKDMRFPRVPVVFLQGIPGNDPRQSPGVLATGNITTLAWSACNHAVLPRPPPTNHVGSLSDAACSNWRRSAQL